MADEYGKIACKECRHHDYLGARMNIDIWYNHECLVPLPNVFDPISGRFVPELRRATCRERNGRGACEFFEGREL